MNSEYTIKPTDRGRIPGSDNLSIVAVCLDGESSIRLKRFIDSIPMAQLRTELQHYLAEEEDTVFVDRLKDLRPDICVIDFDRERERATRTAERIHEALDGIALFAVSSNSQPELIIRAMRCGCSEYLIKPLDRDQLLEALARVGGRRKERREQISGQVLAFLGAKGGSGVTTLVIHLAALLAKLHSRKTLLVDLHPDLGDASLFLGLKKHQYHFYELAENTHRLDGELLQGFVVRHPSGLDVLPAPDGFETPRHVLPDAVERTLEFLRVQYELVMVDCQSGLTEQNMAVVERSDQVYLVATPEIPALRNMARYLDYLGRFHYPEDKVRVVINRHLKSGSIPDAQIEKAIRRSIYWTVPNQYSEVMKTINTGDPLALVGRSEFMRKMSGWAEALAGKSAEDPKAKKKEAKGMLGLFER